MDTIECFRQDAVRIATFRKEIGHLLEGLVCEGLDNFTTDTGHLNDNQWGFRQGRSTEDLLIHLTETWKIALDNRQVVGVVFIDFQKAFDTVSHETLRYKLQAMGFNGNLLDWLTSYLKDRKQFASVNGYCSQTKMVSYGVSPSGIPARTKTLHVLRQRPQ